MGIHEEIRKKIEGNSFFNFLNRIFGFLIKNKAFIMLFINWMLMFIIVEAMLC